jgi:hypothetical protein
MEHRALWRLSLADGAVTRLTQLQGQRGYLREQFAEGDRFLYFVWSEDQGDVWVMDVATNDDR